MLGGAYAWMHSIICMIRKLSALQEHRLVLYVRRTAVCTVGSVRCNRQTRASADFWPRSFSSFNCWLYKRYILAVLLLSADL